MREMSLEDIVRVLESGERTGEETDEPEGARVLMLSDTLAKDMAKALRGIKTFYSIQEL